MPSSRIPDSMSVQPMTVAQATDMAIDLYALWFNSWLEAYAADVRTYWLTPYFKTRPDGKPKGYYFDLARVRRP